MRSGRREECLYADRRGSSSSSSFVVDAFSSTAEAFRLRFFLFFGSSVAIALSVFMVVARSCSVIPCSASCGMIVDGGDGTAFDGEEAQEAASD